MRLLLFLLLAVWSTLAWAGTVDLNTATATQLETLPGIGPSKAAAIIQYRTEHGPFTSVSQLDNVPGIGPATLTNLQGLVSVGESAAAPAAPAEESPEPAASGSSTPPATTVSASGGKININTATAAQLEDLPGIGPSKAAAILEYRTKNGPFASCQGLSSVTGIGQATLTALLDSCTVE